MTTKIEVRTDDPSTGVRSFAWPVLQRGDMSFPEGAYVVEIEPDRDRSSFSLAHRIEGAPLIKRLLSDNKAGYVCSISSPSASYRETHVSSDPKHRIKWDPDDLGAPPFFSPMIVSTESYSCKLDSGTDGIADLWHGKYIHLEKGSKLVLGPAFQLQASLLSLLVFKPDDQLSKGQFEVKPNTEDGFRFNVHLANDLFRFLKYKTEPGVRRNIMSHVVGSALALLQRDYGANVGDDGWQDFANLKTFAEYLKSEDLPTWNEDEFRPDRVSTTVYPHVVPRQEDDDE